MQTTPMDFLVGLVANLIASVIFDAAKYYLSRFFQRRRSARTEAAINNSLGQPHSATSRSTQVLSVPPSRQQSAVEQSDDEGYLDVLGDRIGAVAWSFLLLIFLYIIVAWPIILQVFSDNEVMYFDQAFGPPSTHSEWSWLLPHEPVTPDSPRLFLYIYILYALGLMITEYLSPRIARHIVRGFKSRVSGQRRLTTKLLNDVRAAVSVALLLAVAVISSYIYGGDSYPRGLLELFWFFPIPVGVVTCLLPPFVFVSVLIAGLAPVVRQHKHSRKYG